MSRFLFLLTCFFFVSEYSFGFAVDLNMSSQNIGETSFHEIEFTTPLLTTRIQIDWSEFGAGAGRGVDLNDITADDVELTGLTGLGAAVLGSISVDNTAKTIDLYILLGLVLGGEVTIRINDIKNPPSPLGGDIVVTVFNTLGQSQLGNEVIAWLGGDLDTDEDGLPDGFETYYSASSPAYRNAALNPLVANDPENDFDGDGSSNWREFMGATNPASASSFPSTADTDGDFIYDIDESFPGETVDTDGDGTPDRQDGDSDGDGVPDRVEAGDNNLLTAAVDTDGDGTRDFQDLDSDGDGILDETDNCRIASNANQLDTDDDGEGDSCDTDDDNDGVTDSEDNCRLVSNVNQENNDQDSSGDACDDDDDNDGIGDDNDNCRLVSNENQQDTDGDGIGNACQSDFDGDGIKDDSDNCPNVKNLDQADNDSDGDGDACDADDDGDSIVDPLDNCPFISNLDQSDTDENGIGDACDLESFRVRGSGCGVGSFSPWQSFGYLIGAFLLLYTVRRKLNLHRKN